MRRSCTGVTVVREEVLWSGVAALTVSVGFCCCCFVLLRRACLRRAVLPRNPLAQTSQSNSGSSNSSSQSNSNTQAQTDQYTLSHERYEKAVSYSRAGYTLYFISYFIGTLVLLLLLRLGVAAKFRDMAESASGNKWIQGLIFIPLFILTTDIFDLPVRVYWHALSLRYEQSVQRWGSWLVDWLKGELLGIGLSVLLVMILYLVMRKSPRRWWFYFWLAALPLLLFLLFISPWFIDPIFNHYEPLANEHPELVQSIANLTQRAGVPIPADRIFLMRASEKTNAINAYVTGIGASKRVVIWDTTIKKTTSDEALFIVGHELGHYVLGHVVTGFIYFAIALLARFVHHVSRVALDAGSLGRGVENLRAGRLGVSGGAGTHLTNSDIRFFAGGKWFEPHAGTRRRRLRPGNNSRDRAELRRSGGAWIPGTRRTGSLRP